MTRNFNVAPIHTPHGYSSVPVPDNLTVPQFLLDDYEHPLGKLRRGAQDDWFIDDTTGRKVSFGELKTRSSYLARGLANYGMKSDDVVLFLSANHPDFPVAIWAIHRLGAVVALANPKSSPEALINLLRVCRVSRIVTQRRYLGDLIRPAAAAVGISPEFIILIGSKQSVQPDFTLAPGEAKTKVAFLLFSSYSSSKPKAKAISHYSVIADIVKFAALQRDGPVRRAMMPGDVITGLFPFHHLFGACFLGLVVDIIPKFSRHKLLASIHDYHISHLLLLPSLVPLICEEPSATSRDFTHVKTLSTGPDPLPASQAHAAAKLFPNGLISQSVTGWLSTGNDVRFLSGGKLFVVDGSKETIAVGPFHVSPEEIEVHLKTHRYVADACVIPRVDDVAGEIPLAFIVPTVKANLIASATGKGEGVSAIARTIQDSPSGKILRRVLRDGLNRSLNRGLDFEILGGPETSSWAREFTK
ncbi:amp dependent CoA ligase [Roridomyces roridus]|uniref:Amp dependent CoA ligase n=1 Tax=Roridomyces roridus TaxID=1738132 RepID=A0AAD7CCD1_9AGAR|nr:amp dependent CoA ligase [Roridomyces roridus]